MKVYTMKLFVVIDRLINIYKCENRLGGNEWYMRKNNEIHGKQINLEIELAVAMQYLRAN